jgi:acyl phosphate:glycerol-3-phosphate acyltransferase
VLELGLKSLIGYLLGSFMGALLVGQLRGVDIRQLGSGNAGGTNALRTQGLAFAAAVVVIDVGKGWLAAGWLPGWSIPGIGLDATVDRDWLTAACGLSAVFGHVWPLWYDFRGGKGAATMVGALVPLAPWLLVPVIATWVAVVLVSGYVAVATMLAALVAPLVLLTVVRPMPWPVLCLTGFLAAFLVWTHRSNILRLRAGRENRMNQLWLFAPRDARR